MQFIKKKIFKLVLYFTILIITQQGTNTMLTSTVSNRNLNFKNINSILKNIIIYFNLFLNFITKSIIIGQCPI